MKNSEKGFVLLDVLISFFVVVFFVMASGSLIKAMSNARKEIGAMDAAIHKFYQTLGRREGGAREAMTVTFLSAGENRDVIAQKKYQVHCIRGPRGIFYGGI